MKRVILAVIAVFVAWSAMDFVIPDILTYPLAEVSAFSSPEAAD